MCGLQPGPVRLSGKAASASWRTRSLLVVPRGRAQGAVHAVHVEIGGIGPQHQGRAAVAAAARQGEYIAAGGRVHHRARAVRGHQPGKGRHQVPVPAAPVQNGVHAGQSAAVGVQMGRPGGTVGLNQEQAGASGLRADEGTHGPGPQEEPRRQGGGQQPGNQGPQPGTPAHGPQGPGVVLGGQGRVLPQPLQAGQPARCSSTAVRLAGLATSSRYSGSKSPINSQGSRFMVLLLHPGCNFQPRPAVGHPAQLSVFPNSAAIWAKGSSQNTRRVNTSLWGSAMVCR